MSKIESLMRNNIAKLVAYSSARDEFKGKGQVFLDANENPYNTGFNRYPDPGQQELKERISRKKTIPAENIFLGNGSDEAIDLLIRVFCEPSRDEVLAMSPSYGMYKVCADVNDIVYNECALDRDFRLDADVFLQSVTENTKIIFLCSPNNPSGNSIPEEDIRRICNSFRGIVVLDEAYIDFSLKGSMLKLISEFENLVVLQTFSKAWGLAGLRLGLCFANSIIIRTLNKVKFPYNVNSFTQNEVLKRLDNCLTDIYVREIVSQREFLMDALSRIDGILKVYSSDANFLLVKIRDAKSVYESMKDEGVILRDRSSMPGLENCIRISVGTPGENEYMLEKLKKVLSKSKKNETNTNRSGVLV